MPTVIREIHIDAPPHVVRRHVTDPAERRGWLDDDVDERVPAGGRDLEYPSPRGPGHVRIEVVPDGDGSRVRVTEDVMLPGEDDQAAPAVDRDASRPPLARAA